MRREAGSEGYAREAGPKLARRPILEGDSNLSPTRCRVMGIEVAPKVLVNRLESKLSVVSRQFSVRPAPGRRARPPSGECRLTDG